MQNKYKEDEFYRLSTRCTENVESNLNAWGGWISVTVYDLHLLVFPDKTKAIRSQDHSEKVVQMKKKW